MDRVWSFLRLKRDAHPDEYEPLHEEATALEGSVVLEGQDEVPFSWLEYGIFAFLGMAMLWAWNMYLAATPYFQMRFQADPWISKNFQSAILAVFTAANLTAMTILTNIQHSASYPFRINCALVTNTVAFSLLAASTIFFVGASPPVYLAFLLFMAGLSAWATGMIQNGAFAFAAGFGRPEYMQALMAGQGVAGVLPPIAQIVTVLGVPDDGAAKGSEKETSGNAAFVYFFTAVLISTGALLSFIPLVRRHKHMVENRMVERMAESMTSIEEAERAARRHTSLWRLFSKLHWLAGALFMCFAIAMFFPVFTGKILSVRESATGIFQPGAFIPLGFFFWSLGDLLGRVATLIPFSLQHRPVALFFVGIARILFLPLYLLCNINGRGAVISSDMFYLFIVQLPFGLTNGWLGSSCFMASGDMVDEGEREAAGSFMGLCLVAGLTVGSLLSFSVAGI